MAEATIDAKGINRREFLYYIWGASMALFVAEFGGLVVWFLLPRFREGEFGGKFPTSLEEIPAINQPPNVNAKGRFWLVDVDTAQPNDLMYPVGGDGGEVKGVIAIYTVCTHLGCIYKWNEANDRFECPCHGSKYRLDGRRIEDPAPRTLDRFQILALDADGVQLAASEEVDGHYQPLILPEGTASISVDTGQKNEGPSDQLICDVLGTCP